MKYCVVEKKTSEQYDHVCAGGEGVNPLEVRNQVPVSTGEPFAWMDRTADGVCYVRSVGEPEHQSINGRLYAPSVPRIAIFWVGSRELAEDYRYDPAALDRIAGARTVPGADQPSKVRDWAESGSASRLTLLGATASPPGHRTSSAPLPPMPAPTPMLTQPSRFPLLPWVLAAVGALLAVICLWAWAQLNAEVKGLRAEVKRQNMDQVSRSASVVATQGDINQLGKEVSDLKVKLGSLQKSADDRQQAVERLEKSLAALGGHLGPSADQFNQLRNRVDKLEADAEERRKQANQSSLPILVH